MSFKTNPPSKKDKKDVETEKKVQGCNLLFGSLGLSQCYIQTSSIAPGRHIFNRGVGGAPDFVRHW